MSGALSYEIPLVSSPQTLSIALAGVSYNLRLKYCDNASSAMATPYLGWILDINDSSGNSILCGIPLVIGVDLLDPYQYLNLGGSLICSIDGDLAGPIPFAGLGSSSHLYFVTSS